MYFVIPSLHQLSEFLKYFRGLRQTFSAAENFGALERRSDNHSTFRSVALTALTLYYQKNLSILNTFLA